MILNQANSRDIQIEGIEDSKQMNISLSQETQSHIIKVLTETYKYPAKSIVRENFSNHWDSHYENGNIETPILVKLYKNDTYNYTLETQDFGLGMSKEEFYKYYLGIGESTKRNKPFLIGGMGMGCKAALSYTNSFEVITRKNGVECKFLIYKGEEFPECTEIYEKPTTESNGVTIKVPVDRYDFSSFKEAIKTQLCYFPTALIQIEGDTFDYKNAKLFENDLFIWSEINPEEKLHISFNNCNYPIDWDVLKTDKIYLPVAIKIAIDSGVTPEFNRESLQYSKATKELILSKIKEIASWFVNKYNEENNKEFDTIREIYDQLEYDNKQVTITNKTFNVKDITKYSDIQLVDWKVKGYSNLQPLKWFTSRKSDMFEEYQQIAKYNGRTWSTKRCYDKRYTNFNNSRYQFVICEGVPTIHLKQYLINKFPRKELIVLKRSKKLKLFGSTSYMDICKLYNWSKDKWRTIIQDWQRFENEFISTIPNFTGVQETPEYIKFVEDYKEEQKANRKSGYYSGNYKTLDKQKGDITISYCRSKEIGIGYMFEKKAIPLTNLYKEKCINLYFTEDTDKQLASNLYDLLRQKVKVCFIGKQEIKKVTNIKQFYNYKQFMDSKFFKRIVTSQLFANTIEQYETILEKEGMSIIKNCVEPFDNDINTLRKYTSKNGRQIKDNEVLESMKSVAKEQNLYDFELWDVYQRVKTNIDKYSFVSLLKNPNSYWTKETTKEMNSLITQIMYHKFITNKQLPEGLEIQFVEKEKVELQEPEEIMA